MMFSTRTNSNLEGMCALDSPCSASHDSENHKATYVCRFAENTKTAHLKRHPDASPKMGPLSGPETRPQKLKAHSAPSTFVALICVLFLDPVLGSQKPYL